MPGWEKACPPRTPLFFFFAALPTPGMLAQVVGAAALVVVAGLTAAFSSRRNEFSEDCNFLEGDEGQGLGPKEALGQAPPPLPLPRAAPLPLPSLSPSPLLSLSPSSLR